MNSAYFKDKVLTALQGQINCALENRELLTQQYNKVQAVLCDDTNGFTNLLSKINIIIALLDGIVNEDKFGQLTLLQKLCITVLIFDTLADGKSPVDILSKTVMEQYDFNLYAYLLSNTKPLPSNVAKFIADYANTSAGKKLNEFFPMLQAGLETHYEILSDYVKNPYMHTTQTRLAKMRLSPQEQDKQKNDIDVAMNKHAIFDPHMQTATIGTTGLACCVGVYIAAKTKDGASYKSAIGHISKDFSKYISEKMMPQLKASLQTGDIIHEMVLVGGSTSSILDIVDTLSKAKELGLNIVDISVCIDLSVASDTEIWFDPHIKELRYFTATDRHVQDPNVGGATSSSSSTHTNKKPRRN